MDSPKEDMDLSEFISLCTAKQVPGTSDYIVEFLLADGKKTNLTVAGAYSEFEAKERVYLYLVDKIYNKPA